MKIVTQSLVKNEQRFIWFALRSVVEWVDEMMVWDTGSSDQTREIVKSLDNPNIKFRSVDGVDALSHTQMRQQMLEATNADWFIILDGDEVWWRESISQLIDTILAHPNASAIISPFYNAVGDIWHYQDPSQISYRIHDLKGGYTIRAINRHIPGLHITHPHGRQEYQTFDGTAIQSLPMSKLLFVDAPFLHLTHLRRSSFAGDRSTLKRSFKYRYDLGRSFLPAIFPPEAFYFPRPTRVADPFAKRGLTFDAISILAAAARMVKHHLFPLVTSGY